MKSEILFKAKRVDNGEWVDGLLIESKNDECHILVKNYNPIKKQGNGHWYIDSPCFQVSPETVCQFTGLLDKNGIKIFEGDKLKNKFGNYVVEFCDGSFWVCNIDHEDNVPLYVHNEESEITGNIHDK